MNLIVRIKMRIESDIRIKLGRLNKERNKERKIMYLYVYNLSSYMFYVI